SKWVRPSLAGADCGSDFLVVMVRRMQTGTIAVSGYHSTRENEIDSFLFFSAVGAGTAGMAICCDGDAGRFYAAGVAVTCTEPAQSGRYRARGAVADHGAQAGRADHAPAAARSRLHG